MGLLVEPPEVAEAAQRQNPLHALVGGMSVGAPVLVARPASVSWAHLRDGTLDQGPTNSCVGCTFSTATYLRAKILGRPIPRPSAKLFYDGARLSYGDVELLDNGCYPLDAVRFGSEKGMVPWAAWPLLEPGDAEMRALVPEGKTWIDTPPDFGVFHQAIDARVVGYLRADAGDVVAQLEAALVLGQIPGFGMLIPGDYGSVRGKEVYDIASDAVLEGLGAHMQAIVGYDEVSFLIDSSWGAGHGDNGIVRIAKNVIRRNDVSFARTIVTTVPRMAA